MAFLNPHFDPDVFVSYSHGDPRGAGDSPLKSWTHGLIDRLEREILCLDTEFDDLRIWMDKHIDPTAHLTEALREKVSASGILMIVLSKRYLGSSWCRDELDWFRRQIQDRVGDQGRVFILRIQETAEKSWPEFLRDERGHAMPGFTFYDPAEGEYPFGWSDLNDARFRQQLCRLQTALTKRLRELRERAEKRALAQEVSRTAANQPPPGKRRIYLHAPSEAGTVRADIGGLLSQDGIVPMTAQHAATGGMAAWQQDGKLRREMAKRCEALALLRADDDGERFEGDVFEVGVDDRERIANERGAPLPCAVLDKTGAGPPFDLGAWDIEHFDVTREGWRGAFKSWLDANRASPAGPAP